MTFDFVNENKKEKALLVAVDTGDYDAQASMRELAGLADTAGAEVVASVIQKRDSVDGALFLGRGRLNEIADFCEKNDVDIIIADSELSPVQARNIEDAAGTRVIDRTTLILDIFALRAASREGKLQVELAQLQYLLPRLTGKGTKLSRLGGGIGTRGPGETKLETDRRHIRTRIQSIKKELSGVERRRELRHKRRKKNGVTVAAIVGYTNAGKSTLMNRLTNAGVLEEDKLFATLDPTARRLRLPDGQVVMLVDTVGFISRLPHQLVDAFHSTLEEAAYADIILNVCDASDSEMAEHIKVTMQTLSSLFDGGIINVPVINVFNKCDIVGDTDDIVFDSGTPSVMISAATGQGIDSLLNAMTDALPVTRQRVKLLLPFDKVSLAAKIRQSGAVHSEQYTEKGLFLDCTAEISFLNDIKDYIIG